MIGICPARAGNIEERDIDGSFVVASERAAVIDRARIFRGPAEAENERHRAQGEDCLLYTSPSPRDRTRSRMPSSA